MKIDFYILETTSRQKSSLFACQLLEKIHVKQQKSVFVHTRTREEAEHFDTLLWTYRDDSFIPHQLSGNINDNISPIQIGYGGAPENHHDILLNLSQDIPTFYQQFEHVIEIVFTDPLVQQLARARYKQYRDLGHDINTIKLKASSHD